MDASQRRGLAPRISEKTSRISEELFLGHDKTCPDSIREESAAMVRRTVMTLRTECRTTDASLYYLSRKYGLKSLPRKLFYGEPATIHAHQYFRLQKAFRAALKAARLSSEHAERIAEAME